MEEKLINTANKLWTTWKKWKWKVVQHTHQITQISKEKRKNIDGIQAIYSTTDWKYLSMNYLPLRF